MAIIDIKTFDIGDFAEVAWPRGQLRANWVPAAKTVAVATGDKEGP